MVHARPQQTADGPALADGNQDDDTSDDENEELAHLPTYVIPRVERLQKLNESRNEFIEKYLIERAELENKFQELMRPLYEERASIVKGAKDKEIAKETEALELEKKLDNNEPDSSEPQVKGIPHFWACAMARMEAIGEIITEEDVDCLESLIDIKCIDRSDGKGFTLEFIFESNDYFTNEVLKKEYDVPNLLLLDEPILKNVVGTHINWKKGKCLTHRTVKKKQRGKGKNAGQVRTIEKTEEKESFFAWFDPPKMPSMDELDEEEADRLEEIFDGDYEIAQAFRTEVIPKAVMWFVNEDGPDGEEDDEELEAVLELEDIQE